MGLIMKFDCQRLGMLRWGFKGGWLTGAFTVVSILW